MKKQVVGKQVFVICSEYLEKINTKNECKMEREKEKKRKE